MLTVEEQLRNDPETKRLLASIRNCLESLGMESDLRSLLELWDEAIVVPDFGAVAANYPNFIQRIMVNLGKRDTKEERGHQPVVDEGYQSLLHFAIVGQDHNVTNGPHDIDVDEACAELGGMLEAMDQYNDPLYYTSAVPGLEGRWDISEPVESEPILLYDFLFELEGFLTNLLHVKWRWSRSISGNRGGHVILGDTH